MVFNSKYSKGNPKRNIPSKQNETDFIVICTACTTYFLHQLNHLADFGQVEAVLKDLGSEAEGFADVWSFCGAPETERWTWDTTQNSNVAGNFACKARFDRMIFMTPGAVGKMGRGDMFRWYRFDDLAIFWWRGKEM